MTVFDKRLTPARPDLAATYLRGQVDAARFVEPTPMRVAAGSAPLRRAPGGDAPLDTELLYGETFDAYETAGGFAWGQARGDGYVGYVPAAALAAPGGEPTHRVATLRTYAYPGPSIKLPPRHLLSMGALVAAVGEDGRFMVTADGDHIWATHLAPLDRLEPDHASVAARFLGTPYLWGGRSSLGLDCSGLTQLALTAAGIACRRDSDMQEKLGAGLDIGPDLAGLERGDLVFWKGHVGVMLDGERLLHANGFHMLVEVEPLAAARGRIGAAGAGEITSFRRLASAA